MKTIVLHGDYQTKLYARLTKFLEVAKKRGWEIIEDEITATPSLFGVERLTVIRKYQLLSKKEVDFFSRIPGTLVIYHEGTIPQSFLKLLPKDLPAGGQGAKTEEFKLPKIIFKFLDTFSIKVFHEIINKEPVEFVFALLAKRLRDLYWIKIEPKTLNYPSWQMARLRTQAKGFTNDKLKELINLLSEIDINVKTSKADLVSSLDLLLISKLK